jgi:DNA-binding SARP family transcriptional activator
MHGDGAGSGARGSVSAGPAPDAPIAVITLGQFDIRRDGRSLLPPGKLQRRPVALLLLLVAEGPQGARKEALAERLWPDDDRADGARLKVTLHRLRRLLGDPGAVRAQASTLAPDPARLHVDAWEIDRLAAAPMAGPETCAAALALYGGPFAADLAGDSALLIYGQYLEGRFEAAMVAGIRALAAGGDIDAALAAARLGLMRVEAHGPLLEAAIALAAQAGRGADAAALAALAAALSGDDAP